MSTSKIDLILHPVRIRIITTISGREMTVQQIAAALPDVAQATLYRHINALTDGGILVIVEENPVRGTVEKVYALAEDESTQLSPEDVANLGKDDHMRFFTIFMTTMLNHFSNYLDAKDKPDPAQDGVGYHTVPLYMTDQELQDFARNFNEMIRPYLQDHPDAKRRLFSTILIPDSSE